MYSLFLVSSILVAFLKPKQELQELTEEKVDHLGDRINDREKALALQDEFIRNIRHEFHAPQTGITSMAETLVESYDKLDSKQLRLGIDTILKSSRRLD